MVEVLLGPIVLKSNASVYSKVRRIFSVKNNFVGNATINGRSVKIVKSKSNFVATAIILSNSFRLIKYVRASLKSKTNVVSDMHKYKTTGANLLGQASLETYAYDRDIRASMFDYLPPYYRDIKDIQALIISEANEFTMLNAKLDELFNQFFIDTATYSLDDWENAVNVKRKKQTIPERRQLVKQNLNGLGTVTPAVLKNVVDDFYFSDMSELPEPGVIEFKILGKRGIPDNITDIKDAVNEVIPRHLESQINYSYLPWEEVEAFGLTWEQAENFTYKELEEVFLIEPSFPHEK